MDHACMHAYPPPKKQKWKATFIYIIHRSFFRRLEKCFKHTYSSICHQLWYYELHCKCSTWCSGFVKKKMCKYGTQIYIQLCDSYQYRHAVLYIYHINILSWEKWIGPSMGEGKTLIHCHSDLFSYFKQTSLIQYTLLFRFL